MYHSQLQEHLDHEEGARYDHIRERYASELRDIALDAEIEEENHQYMNQVWLAGFGEDWQAYEAYWKASMAYADKILGTL
tara:strand:- start:4558 stop:4797 length:240 start_codon:yes stop_codon:yes gene_type:complete